MIVWGLILYFVSLIISMGVGNWWGYSTGLNSGFDVGYNHGYQQGYEDIRSGEEHKEVRKRLAIKNKLSNLN